MRLFLGLLFLIAIVCKLPLLSLAFLVLIWFFRFFYFLKFLESDLKYPKGKKKVSIEKGPNSPEKKNNHKIFSAKN